MVTWGTTPGMGRRSPAACPTPSSVPTRAEREAAARALDYMGLDAGHADRGHRGGHACSSARAPTRASRTCAPRRGARRAQGGRTGVRVLVVPGSSAVRRRRRPRGSTGSSASAGAEWRDAGCSMCLGMNADMLQPGERCASHEQPQLRGPAGAGRAHASRVARRWRPPPRWRGAWSTSVTLAVLAASRLHEAVSPRRTAVAVASRPCRRRHRPDHPQAIPQDASSAPGFGPALFDDWRLTRPTARRDPDFVLNRRDAPGARARRRRATSAAARRASTRSWALGGLGLPRRDRAVLRRHLPQQRPQQRPAAGDVARARGAGPPRPRRRAARGSPRRSTSTPRR